MKLPAVGLLVTSGGVLILLGSMIAGMAGRPSRAPAPSLAVPVPSERQEPAASVEVLNGAGVPGLAREVTERLRRLGYDVKYYGNAPGGQRDSTVVLIRRGDGRPGERVASSLSIDRVQMAIDTTLYLDATLILGKDWTDR